MVRTWPAVVGRVRVPTALVGQVALALLLAATVTSSWRDGSPTDQLVDMVAPPPSAIADKEVAGKPQPGSKVPVITRAPQPQGPTAQPVELLIPSLDVHRPVEMVGTDQFGVMNLPVNAWNGGWYTGSPVPGAPGDAVIEGHAGYPGKPMMFGKLATLHRGDRIIVVLADGSKQLFLVVSMRSVPIGLAPPGMAAYTGPARLTLITCTGSFDKKSYSYSNRLLLEARYAGPA
jgi:LPXTG-site transpeptidase (sortase) family protein